MGDLEIRRAVADDVPAIVAMLADDPLGAKRESPDDLTPYLTALERLSTDPNQHVVVAVVHRLHGSRLDLDAGRDRGVVERRLQDGAPDATAVAVPSYTDQAS